jgi:hypothetical protein
VDQDYDWHNPENEDGNSKNYNNFLLMLDSKDDHDDDFDDFEIINEANHFVDSILEDNQEKHIRYD